MMLVLQFKQYLLGYFHHREAPWPHGLGGPGLSPGQGHCVVFLGKTLYSHSASLHPSV